MTLLFKRQFLTKILWGQKTQTRRLRRPQVTVGKSYRLSRGYRRIDQSIRVTDLYQQRLGDITGDDITKEGFESPEDFKKAWAGIYGYYNPDIMIWVVDFTLEKE